MVGRGRRRRAGERSNRRYLKRDLLTGAYRRATTTRRPAYAIGGRMLSMSFHAGIVSLSGRRGARGWGGKVGRAGAGVT